MSIIDEAGDLFGRADRIDTLVRPAVRIAGLAVVGAFDVEIPGDNDSDSGCESAMRCATLEPETRSGPSIADTEASDPTETSSDRYPRP